MLDSGHRWNFTYTINTRLTFLSTIIAVIQVLHNAMAVKGIPFSAEQCYEVVWSNVIRVTGGGVSNFLK